MHDIKWIREHPEEFDHGLKRRGLPPLARRLLELDERRRMAVGQIEAAQARRRSLASETRDAMARRDEALARRLSTEAAGVKTILPALESQERSVTEALKKALEEIPNLPLEDVPTGESSKDNVERHRFFPLTNHTAGSKEHFELGEALGQMDFQTAAKLSGSRFVVLKKQLARLERALGQFMLDVHTNDHGYTEVLPPLLVRDHVMYGTGQLPKFHSDQFLAYSDEDFMKLFGDLMNDLPKRILDRVEDKGITKTREDFSEFSFELATDTEFRYWLIPTAEVPLTNLVREQILDEHVLPLRFTALTPCFRAEAGAAGKDTRGMLRQHQFDKVELVSITTPEQSRNEHECMLSCAEQVLKRLDLHYRVVTLCTGDMGFASQKTYDIEVWLPGQGAYREISSCSVCGEFQARRMDARYRSKADRSVRHVHTLNGSGVAVGRALIAVMETYQDQGGGIAVPDALQPYMGGIKRIERAPGA